MAQNSTILADLEVDNFVRQPTEEEVSKYELNGRDPRGLLIEKDIRIEMIDKKNKVIIQKLYEITKKNLELEQEIAQGNKRFRDLLQAKSKQAIPAYLFDYFMQSHPLLNEDDREAMLKKAQEDEENKVDPKDLKIQELNEQIKNLNMQLVDMGNRMDDVIEEWKKKLSDSKGNYTDLFAEHEQLKADYQAKDEESKFYQKEFAKYKEQYDERLVTRLTDQIDHLGLDIAML